MERVCKWCGCTFTRSEGVKGNNEQYCSQSCRVRGYSENKRIARKKYREAHKNDPKPKRTKIHIRRCRYCGNQFVGVRNNMYCSLKCKKYAKKEQSCKSTIKYDLNHKNDKKDYFANLGNSNLREHKKDDFKDEARLIRAEKKRLNL